MLKIKPIALYLILTFTISWTFQILSIRAGVSQNSLWELAVMWTPGLVAVLCALTVGGGWKDLALTKPKFKYLGFAYIVPAWVALLMLILLVVTRTGEFQIRPEALAKRSSLGALLFAALVVAPTIGMLVAIFSGLGEEIGWRGFLHTQLLPLPPVKRYLVIGLIWSVWHWPLIFLSEYASSPHPVLSVILFTIGIVGAGVFMGYLRDRSQSVFPAAVVHGSHNMWILGIAPIFYKEDELTPYFAGESGVFCVLIYAALAYYIIRLQRKSS